MGSVGRFGTGFRNGCLIGSKEYALKGVYSSWRLVLSALLWKSSTSFYSLRVFLDGFLHMHYLLLTTFFKIKNVEKIKNVKNVKNVT